MRRKRENLIWERGVRVAVLADTRRTEGEICGKRGGTKTHKSDENFPPAMTTPQSRNAALCCCSTISVLLCRIIRHNLLFPSK